MKTSRSYRLLTVAVILFYMVIGSGCARQQSPPPNPVVQGSASTGGGSVPSGSPSAPRPMFYDFPDIPVPFELSRVDSDTFVFQSGPLKAGLLGLRGTRVDVSSVISFFQMAMPREGWKPKGGFLSGRTVLIFEKPEKTAVINIYQKMFRTYVEIYVAPHNAQM